MKTLALPPRKPYVIPANHTPEEPFVFPGWESVKMVDLPSM